MCRVKGAHCVAAINGHVFVIISNWMKLPTFPVSSPKRIRELIPRGRSAEIREVAFSLFATQISSLVHRLHSDNINNNIFHVNDVIASVEIASCCCCFLFLAEECRRFEENSKAMTRSCFHCVSFIEGGRRRRRRRHPERICNRVLNERPVRGHEVIVFGVYVSDNRLSTSVVAAFEAFCGSYFVVGLAVTITYEYTARQDTKARQKVWRERLKVRLELSASESIFFSGTIAWFLRGHVTGTGTTVNRTPIYLQRQRGIVVLLSCRLPLLKMGELRQRTSSWQFIIISLWQPLLSMPPNSSLIEFGDFVLLTV